MIRENGFPLPRVATIPPGYTPLPDPGPEDRRSPAPRAWRDRSCSSWDASPRTRDSSRWYEAFSTLATHDPTSTLVIVGEDGGMRAAVEAEVARLGLGPRVRITGYVSDDRRLAAAFRDARLFVLPSEYESFGLVLLEALAQGTPVVASRVGGIPEFVPDGSAGRLVPPSDVEALSRALLELWDDEKRQDRLGNVRADPGRPPVHVGPGRGPASRGLRGGPVPVRIVQVTLRFDAPGGVETNVREVAKRVEGSGDDVRVYASDLYDEDRWERRTGTPRSSMGCRSPGSRSIRRAIPGLTMPMWPGLIRALSGSGADVIHAHSHRYGHVLQAAAVARRRGTPLIVSTHYHPADRHEGPWKRGLLRVQDHLFGMTAYRVARALVVETELEARLVREFAPADRVRMIPPGSTSGNGAPPTSTDRPRACPTVTCSTPAGSRRTRVCRRSSARSHAFRPTNGRRWCSWAATGESAPVSRPSRPRWGWPRS